MKSIDIKEVENLIASSKNLLLATNKTAEPAVFFFHHSALRAEPPRLTITFTYKVSPVSPSPSCTFFSNSILPKRNVMPADT